MAGIGDGKERIVGNDVNAVRVYEKKKAEVLGRWLSQWLRALAAFSEVKSSIPAGQWWLTTICNEI